jgi:hypothetical protein
VSAPTTPTAVLRDEHRVILKVHAKEERVLFV